MEQPKAEQLMPEQPEPTSSLPLPLVVFFNALIVMTLVLMLANTPPCVSPIAHGLSVAVLLVLFAHVIWRSFHKEIRQMDGNLNLGILKIDIPIRGLAALLDKLHPWVLSDIALWGLAIVLGGIAWGLGLSVFSPFPIIEPTPLIQSFSVRDRSGSPQVYPPDQVIEIKNGQLLFVAAEGVSAKVLCTWSSAVKGPLSLEPGCSVQYIAPLTGNMDMLTVQVQSHCKTRSTFASLQMIIQP